MENQDVLLSFRVSSSQPPPPVNLLVSYAEPATMRGGSGHGPGARCSAGKQVIAERRLEQTSRRAICASHCEQRLELGCWLRSPFLTTPSGLMVDADLLL